MSGWDTYQSRIEARGVTKRETLENREIAAIYRKLPDNLSYTTVSLFDCMHGYNIESEEMQEYKKEKKVAIINSDNLNEKYLLTMPREDIENGSLILWMGEHWLVTERDANSTIYTRVKMVQCNHLLKWVSADHKIIKQWCIIEDGTKYLTGEYEDKRFIAARGDTRIYMELARNRESLKLNRTSRFIIDDDDSPVPLAYDLTKPLKLGGSFNQRGVFKFVLTETALTDNDDTVHHIADYYKHFPRQPWGEGTEPTAPGATYAVQTPEPTQPDDEPTGDPSGDTPGGTGGTDEPSPEPQTEDPPAAGTGQTGGKRVWL